MQSRTFALCLLSFALGACSDSSDGTDSVADAKLTARAELEGAMRDQQAGDAIAAPTTPTAPPAGTTKPVADVCQERAWYGDGECDAWCPQGDAKDCAPNSGGVACAAFFSPADGFCNRSDPCGPLQDEDCAKQVDPVPPDCAPVHPTPGAPAPDGKCAPTSFAELKSDPDCNSLICPAIYSPTDGICDAKGPCDYLIDADCSRDPGDYNPSSPGVVCDAIAYAANGKCEAPPGCEANDPKDCQVPVACITILYPKNGKCEAAPGCEGSDPDC